MFTKRIVVPLITMLLAVMLAACSGTVTPGPGVTVAAPQTVTITAPPPAVTAPPLPVPRPSDEAAAQRRFDTALNWVELVTRKGTAASIYGLAKALNCVATPEDWKSIQPYINTLYMRAAHKPLPVLNSSTCDQIKNTIEETAARWYESLTSRAG